LQNSALGSQHCNEARDCDIGRTCATRKVIERLGRALQDGAVGIEAGQTLRDLIADVAGIQIGKDQNVRLAGDEARRRLAAAQLRQQRGVGLELAIDLDLEPLIIDFLPGEPERFEDKSSKPAGK